MINERIGTIMRQSLLICVMTLISTSCSLSKITSYEIPQMQSLIPEIQIEHFAYSVSYNPETNIPNWVR